MPTNYLALDIGEKRVGVAFAEAPLYLAQPLLTLGADESLRAEIMKLLEEKTVGTVVVGYPRNMAGEATAQTKEIERVVEALDLPGEVMLVWQDESLTSVKAEEELEKRGKPYQKSEVDSLAASYILEDYIRSRV